MTISRLSYALFATLVFAPSLKAELECDATISTTETSRTYYSEYNWLDSIYGITSTSSYNFTTDHSISFSITPASAGTFTYTPYQTSSDNTLTLMMMFGATDAGNLTNTDYTLTFVGMDSSVTYQITNYTASWLAESPHNSEGMAFSFTISNISDSFSFSSIELTVDYSGEGAEIHDATYSLGNSYIQCGGYVTDSSSNFLTFTPAAVPEPSTYGALAGIAGLATAFVKRGRKIKRTK